MPTETVFENANMTLWFHPEDKIVHHQFHTFMKGEPLQAGLTRGLKVLQERGATKWLSDDRANSALTSEDSEWATKTWFPQAVKGGFKHWAVVLPEKVVGQLNIKRFIQEFSAHGVTAQYFSDPDAAMKWLRSQ